MPEFRFPAHTLALGIVLGVALADALRHDDRQAMFLAQPVTGVADVVVAAFVGMVLFVRHHISRAPHKMVVDMPAVNMGRHDKGVLAAEDFSRQPLADFMCGFG